VHRGCSQYLRAEPSEGTWVMCGSEREPPSSPIMVCSCNSQIKHIHVNICSAGPDWRKCSNRPNEQDEVPVVATAARLT
jgi:hypothetical protein